MICMTDENKIIPPAKIKVLCRHAECTQIDTNIFNELLKYDLTFYKENYLLQGHGIDSKNANLLKIQVFNSCNIQCI